MNTQPKALRLADALEELDVQFSHTGLCGDAAAELRRLHEWVALTDEEIHRIDGYEEDRKMYRFARAIEQALKEKNHG